MVNKNESKRFFEEKRKINTVDRERPVIVSSPVSNVSYYKVPKLEIYIDIEEASSLIIEKGLKTLEKLIEKHIKTSKKG